MEIELSIVVPIYNVEKYLKDCLESLFSIKNIKKEIILVNDGSTDGSLKIAEEYKKNYPNETILINKKNGGLSSARNAGLDIAKGKYISFIDSDDFIDSLKYEQVFNMGKKMGLDIIVGTAIKYKDGNLEKFYRSEEIVNSEILTGNEFLELSFKTNCYRMEVWDDIYLTSLLKENNIQFKEGLLHEDELFTPIVFSKAKKVKLINTSFYYYRQREGSIMHTRTTKNIIAYIYIIKELSKIILTQQPKEYMTQYIYEWYTTLIVKNNIILIIDHFIIMRNLKVDFKKKLWFLKIFKYILVNNLKYSFKKRKEGVM
ncbi:MAG: glycosyltransferase [Cetobacterium sp.]